MWQHDRTVEVRRLDQVSLPRTVKRNAMATFHAAASAGSRLNIADYIRALNYATQECKRALVSEQALEHCAIVTQLVVKRKKEQIAAEESARRRAVVVRRVSSPPPQPLLQYAFVSADYHAIHSQQRLLAVRQIERDIEQIVPKVELVQELLRRQDESLSRLEEGTLLSNDSIHATRDALHIRLGEERVVVGTRLTLAGVAVVAALIILLVL
jgi:hypothetical protein